MQERSPGVRVCAWEKLQTDWPALRNEPRQNHDNAIIIDLS
jgi:hypothetical protein